LPLFAVLGLLLTAALAFAAPPSAPDNDRWKNAQPLTNPDSEVQDPTGATLKGGDPQPSCQGLSATVWYSFTAEFNGTALVNTNGSDYDTVLAVWTRSGGWNEIACDDDSGTDLDSAVAFSFTAGTTYYIQVGVCCNRKDELAPSQNELHLNFAVD
jgi:hypothetical protein